MKIRTVRPPAGGPGSGRVAMTRLRRRVERLAVPRHRTFEQAANVRVMEDIAAELCAGGYHVAIHGRLRNVVARPPGATGPLTIVGAHYDSVARCPGADDNASAVAVMLEVARALAGTGRAVGFIAFNGEEDGLLGSRELVGDLAALELQVRVAHVLEMVGFTDPTPGSQSVPSRLLPGVPKTGDFLGIISKGKGRALQRRVLQTAKRLAGGPPVVGLALYLGLEKLIPDLARSDHQPFWDAGIPALMWTDTSEFRNPHYHTATDTPETLDYRFMAAVARLLLAVLEAGAPPAPAPTERRPDR